MTDPREDALAKVRKALQWIANPEPTGITGGPYFSYRQEAETRAKDALSALSAPPSQSESDALRDANARAGALHFALAVADAAINPTDKAGISMFDWNERLKKATVVIQQALALTPSPTPYVRSAADALRIANEIHFAYVNGDQNDVQTIAAIAAAIANNREVRPAAEIQAEIERAKRHYGLSLKMEGYIDGLTFALTPPTQEPR